MEKLLCVRPLNLFGITHSAYLKEDIVPLKRGVFGKICCDEFPLNLGASTDTVSKFSQFWKMPSPNLTSFGRVSVADSKEEQSLNM